MTPLYRFISASGLTNLADGVATLAWAWVASLLTRDPVLIASVAIALRLPWFLCAIPAGIITDRVDRKRLILIMDIIRAAGFGMAGIALWVALPLGPAPENGVSNIWLFTLFLISAAIVGTAEVFRDNAAQTMLPALVDANDLERANGRLWSVELIGQALIGPALGAFLLTFWAPTPFLFNALAYVLAIALVFQISGNFKSSQRATRDWKAEFLEGYHFLRTAPMLRTFAWITGGWNLVAQLALIALILHVQENLGLSAQAYGLILAAMAVGGIIGALIGDSVVRFLGPWRTAKWMLVASAATFFGFAFAPNAWSLALVLALFELAGLIWNTVSVSYRQRNIPSEILGRVNSLYRMLAWGMIPLGLLLSGLIVQSAESVFLRETALKAPFIVAALGATLLAILGWRAISRATPFS